MSDNGGPFGYGDYLKSIREKKGITIEDVSRQTRIRPEIIERLEAESESELPDTVFVKGFIRSLAEAIGADPVEALKGFKGSESGSGADHLTLSAAVPQKRSSMMALVLSIGVISIVIVSTLMLMRWWSATPGLEPAAETPSPSPVTDLPSPSPASSDISDSAESTPHGASEVPPDAAPTEAADDETVASVVRDTHADRPRISDSPAPLQLRVSAMEDTWMKVIRDQEKPEEYFLKSGDRLELEAQSVYSLLIGNAGGIELELNGERVRLPGKSGQVVTLQLP
jgi:cytoskeletal protein RodZ